VRQQPAEEELEVRSAIQQIALEHRRRYGYPHKSPCARRPFTEISGSISFSPPVFPFPETVPTFVCHFKASPVSGFVYRSVVEGRIDRRDSGLPRQRDVEVL
jgi:hypothetical protein